MFGRLGAKRTRLNYDGANSERHGNWRRISGGVNDTVGRDGAALAARAQDLQRNDAVASIAIAKLTQALTGLMPRGATGDAGLDADIDAIWDQWALEASVETYQTIYGVQSLAIESWKRDGNVFGRFRVRRPEDGLTVPLQVQLLPDSFIARHLTQQLNNGGRIINGVEVDVLGRVTAYHLFEDDPNGSFGSGKVVRVPEAAVFHLHEIGHAGQRLGVSALSPVMVALRDMQLYRESIHTRAAAEAALMAFVTTQEDQDAPTMTASGKTTDAGHPVEELTPGTVGYLSPGQDVKFNEPTASNGFGEVTKIAKQEILTAAGLTYEAGGDLSNVTWTSFRAGQLDHRRMVRHAQRELIVPLMMRRVYVQFVDAAITAGLLPEAARAKQRKLVSGGVLVQGYPVRWQYPPFLEVDGAKQAQSTQALLRAGLATHEAEIEAATGMSMTEYLDAEARYRAEVVKRGLRFDSDPTATTQSGQAQAMPSDPEPVAAKPAS